VPRRPVEQVIGIDCLTHAVRIGRGELTTQDEALLPGLGCAGEQDDAAEEAPRLTAGEAKALAIVKNVSRTLAETDLFSGAVLLAKDGRVLFSKAYGLADREKAIPNTLETRFRIGQ
jgi:CubicO group peptidase (beta-lactamase class C family)